MNDVISSLFAGIILLSVLVFALDMQQGSSLWLSIACAACGVYGFILWLPIKEAHHEQ